MRMKGVAIEFLSNRPLCLGFCDCRSLCRRLILEPTRQLNQKGSHDDRNQANRDWAGRERGLLVRTGWSRKYDHGRATNTCFRIIAHLLSLLYIFKFSTYSLHVSVAQTETSCGTSPDLHSAWPVPRQHERGDDYRDYPSYKSMNSMIPSLDRWLVGETEWYKQTRLCVCSNFSRTALNRFRYRSRSWASSTQAK